MYYQGGSPVGHPPGIYVEFYVYFSTRESKMMLDGTQIDKSI